MKFKTLLSLLLGITILSIGGIIENVSASNGESNTLGYLGYELFYEVNATQQVKIGDSITVKIYFETVSDISDVEIYVSINGAGISYDKNWIGINLRTNQTVVDTLILQATEEGEIICKIEAGYWDDVYGDWEYGMAVFQISEAKITTFAEMEEKLDSLNETYYTLLESYMKLDQLYSLLNQSFTDLKLSCDTLETNYSQLLNAYNKLKETNEANLNTLTSYQILTYIFITTTGMLAIILLLVKLLQKRKVNTKNDTR